MIERARWFLSLLLLSAAAQAALPPLIVDGDGDGVSDEVDDCPYTPPGIQMNERGCPLHADDGDADGVADPQDDCPYTPPDAVVDAQGCALDADFDGIANGIDRCLNTALGALVDERGCAVGQVPAALLSVRPAPPPLTAPPPSVPVPAPAAVVTKPAKQVTPQGESLQATPEPLVPLTPLAPLGISGGAVSASIPAAPALPVVAATQPPPQARASADLQAALLAEEQSRDARLAGAPAVPLPESISESLVFAVRSAELSPAAARKLEALAPALKALATRSASAHVSVAAYADQGEGTKASRYAIRRSELVRAWLLAHGVPAERIRTSIRVLDSGEAAGNRRVDIRTAD
ncbi:MAG: hypothetical protein EPN60_04500 [Nevskiaceae bacterium]|nr:MAG: hypothetical protein EPO48_02560 [Nevskiaceae bacterium]TAM31099.1 MAG: hypothetical protein EPN60_04500 [Nevskiaceae bacterium]